MSNDYKNMIMISVMAIAGAAHSATALAQPAPGKTPAGPQRQPGPSIKPCSSVEMDPKPTLVVLGKTTVVRLDRPVARMIVGGMSTSRAVNAAGNTAPPVPNGSAAAPKATAPAAGPADSDMPLVSDVEITLLGPTELFVLGKRSGSMNVVLQQANGQCLVKDIIVTVDTQALQAKLAELMPEETEINVKSAENSMVLTGVVSDALKLDSIMSLAGAYGDGKRVVNLMRVGSPQQVMLEVKIAEVSKTLLERFGLDYSRFVTSADGLTSQVVSGIIGGRNGVIGRFSPNVSGGTIGGLAGSSVGNGSAGVTAELGSADPQFALRSRGASLLGIEAQQRDGLVRILAEPNIMAISGQQASFLSGGRIFIPVAQSASGAAGSTITLEEKEFGVGLKFMPTVLDGTRVNLKLTSEVSELSQTGSAFTTVGGTTSVLPSITTRRVDTTVQLNDGQSFAVAGLIRHNVTQAIDRFPGLGNIPIVGALFRSTEFQNDKTELLFVITPRLVKPSNQKIVLPTDTHVVPNRADTFLFGKSEGQLQQPAPGSAPAPAPAPTPTPSPAPASRSGERSNMDRTSQVPITEPVWGG